MSNRSEESKMAYPENLEAQENEILSKRESSSEQVFGIGLSGGGIRSATFSLGFFQALAAPKNKLLSKINFLSTVSGGGYFGAFYGSIFARMISSNSQDSSDEVEKILLGKNKPEVVDHLRDNGNYLATQGAGDYMIAVATILRNLLTVNMIMAITVFAVIFLVEIIELLVYPLIPSFHTEAIIPIWWSPVIWLVLVPLIAGALPSTIYYWLCRDMVNVCERWKSIFFPVLLIVTVGILYWQFDYSSSYAVGKKIIVWGVFAFSSIALLAGVLTWCYNDEKWVRKGRYIATIWLKFSLTITLGLLIFVFLHSLGQTVYHAIEYGNINAWFIAIGASITLITPFAERIFNVIKPKAGSQTSTPRWIIALIIGVLLVGTCLLLIDTASHAVVWKFGLPGNLPPQTVAKTADQPNANNVPASGSSVKETCKVPPEFCSPLFGGKFWSEIKKMIPVIGGFAFALLATLSLGRLFSLINSISLHEFYRGRLVRAYLGATNEKRLKKYMAGGALSDAVEDDNMALSEYYEKSLSAGAPIHLINVTINESVDGASKVQRRDRKGTGMAIGPRGVSVGMKHHLTFDDWEKFKNIKTFPLQTDLHHVFDIGRLDKIEFKVKFKNKVRTAVRKHWACENLKLGNWTAISGAAVSTGMGMHSSLGYSLLCGLGNVRLGYWWYSGVNPAKFTGSCCSWFRTVIKYFICVQRRLFCELVGIFYGTSRKNWYLTDGGHFENLGGYELIRRRLPVILLSDAGEDVNFEFENLANLIRKARTDFGAEISFLSDDEIKNAVSRLSALSVDCSQAFMNAFSSLSNITAEPGKDGNWNPLNRHAAIALVKYMDVSNDSKKSESVSLLIYLKASMTGDETPDINSYKAIQKTFPHQSTMDQIFDEAQWESYRALGRHIGDGVSTFLDMLLTDPKKIISIINK